MRLRNDVAEVNLFERIAHRFYARLMDVAPTGGRVLVTSNPVAQSPINAGARQRRLQGVAQ